MTHTFVHRGVCLLALGTTEMLVVIKIVLPTIIIIITRTNDDVAVNRPRIGDGDGDDGTVWVALLRGVNVGGSGILSMKQLTSVLTDKGFIDVKTYIQSGNVVFRTRGGGGGDTHATLSKRIIDAVTDDCGLSLRVMVMTSSELDHAISSNPFSHQAVASPKAVSLFVLSQEPEPDRYLCLQSYKMSSESMLLSGRYLDLHSPDGVGKSKVAGRAERVLGVDITARNWNTITKLKDMCDKMKNSKLRFIR